MHSFQAKSATFHFNGGLVDGPVRIQIDDAPGRHEFIEATQPELNGRKFHEFHLDAARARRLERPTGPR